MTPNESVIWFLAIILWPLTILFISAFFPFLVYCGKKAKVEGFEKKSWWVAIFAWFCMIIYFIYGCLTH
nr:MAG TPA: hypothetical protein [Caudoviricetes sp.]